MFSILQMRFRHLELSSSGEAFEVVAEFLAAEVGGSLRKQLRSG